MKFKRFFFNFFNNWTRPIIFLVISFVLFLSVSFLVDCVELESIIFYILLISVLTILISVVVQLTKGQFLTLFLTLCVLGVTAVAFLYASFALFWKIQSMPDRYADELKIPSNIQVYLPSDTTFSIADVTPNFQLYNSFQPGLYYYSLWTRKIEKGYCYLKAFEVTQNDRLSGDRLKEQSKIEVFNLSDTIRVFEMGKDSYTSHRPFFTIYEGDWGKPYAARFEVWFVPANGE
ncbi:MAG: hypothetical protein M9904_14400 [Chitinophagaceae bacterium]|nr:hypothetical protein [Chitinophagaceae bacterium]